MSHTSEPPAASRRPWWQVAALAGGGAMAVFVVALLIPPGWGLAVFGVGVATFVAVLLNNPAHRLRRLTGACFAAAVATAATPRIAAALDLGSLGVVLIELGADVWIALSFLAAGVALAWLDQRGRAHALPPAESGPKSLRAGVHASEHASVAAGGDVIGRDKHMRDAYGDGSIVYKIEGDATFNQGASPPPPSQPSAREGLPAPLREFLAWQKVQPTGLNLIGVGGGNIRLDLDEVYVPLRLTSRREDFEHRRRAEAPSRRQAPREHDFALVELFAKLDRLSAQGVKHAVLLGAPGSGKTTALRKLVQLCLGRGSSADAEREAGPAVLGLAADTIAVFVRLRRFRDAHLDGDLRDFVCAELREVSRGQLDDATLRALWEHGRLLLLLDGLDEIADAELRARCCNFLKRELRTQANRRLRVIVSCRYTGYEARGVDLCERFAEVALRPLSAEQARNLITRWFGEAAKKIDLYSAREAGEQATALADALGDHTFPQRLKVMYSTPLLLTLLCVVVQQGRDMPRRRADFYDECLQVLLQRWHRGKEQDNAVDLREKPSPTKGVEVGGDVVGSGAAERSAAARIELDVSLALLRPIAYELHSEERREELDEEELALLIQERLKAQERGDDPYEVLEWLEERSGVLVELADGQVGFFHLGVQEYLAAMHILEHGEALVDQLVGNLHLSWWHEVVRLLVGAGRRSDFVGLFERALRRSDLTNPEVAKLLGECIEEAAEVDLSPFLAQLRSERDPERLLTLLGLVQGRRDEELAACAAMLAEKSGDPRVQAKARSLAGTAATTSRADAGSRVVAVLMVESERPAAEAVAKELADCGVTIWRRASLPSLAAIKGKELHKEANVAVLVAGSDPPWEGRGALVRLFAGAAGKVMYGAQVGGSTSIDGAPAVKRWFDLRSGDRLQRVATLAEALRPESGRDASALGDAFVDETTGIRFLFVEGQTFTMGSPEYEDALPHPVTLSDFWIAETPVTNASYGVFLKATGHSDPRYWRDPRFSDPQQPVVGVSWRGAVAFCAWLTEVSGQRVSLPSEAQWEFAARGSDGRRYPWGDQPPDPTRACYEANAEGKPARVGSYPAGRGPFGALDQVGNVWEWCLDVWDPQAYAKHANVDPVAREGDDDWRVLRGGSWYHEEGALAAACRGRYWFDFDNDDFRGFRVVLLPASR